MAGLPGSDRQLIGHRRVQHVVAAQDLFRLLRVAIERRGIAGLALDNVIAFEVVLHDGTTTIVHERREPDLFWAPLDGNAATSLRTATERYRAGTLRPRFGSPNSAPSNPDMSIDDANDVLWFYFGYSGFFTLMDDSGWSADRSEEWLREMAAIAVLGSRGG